MSFNRRACVHACVRACVCVREGSYELTHSALGLLANGQKYFRMDTMAKPTISSADYCSIAVVQYSTYSEIAFNFQRYAGQPEKMVAAVEAIPYAGRSTATARALNLVVDELLTESSPGFRGGPVAVVVVTDGLAADIHLLPAAAQRLQDTNAEVC